MTCQSVNLSGKMAVQIAGCVFSAISVAEIKIIFGYNFVATRFFLKK